MESWKTGASYRDLLKNDAEVVSNLGEDGIDALFDLDQHFRHVDTIFARVFDDTPKG
jgi:adenylosuccinate lyase